MKSADNSIPRRPFLWLAAALVFIAPAMFGTLALWVPATFLAALATKLWMNPKGWRLRSAPVKVVLAIATLAAVFATSGSVVGMEPGVSIIAMLTAIKILEAHTARELQVMVMIGFVLCLCGFSLSQDLIVAFCLLITFVLLLVALIQFHGGFTSSFWLPLRTAAKLFAQAAPVIVLLFLFFPRISGGFRFQIGQPRGAAAGFSGELSPGSVASLANSSDIAFRAEFPDGKIPPPNKMYWRGSVMSHCEGLEWRAPKTPAALPHRSANMSGNETVRQWITIEPHRGHWLFALDWPINAPPGSFLAPGNQVWSAQTVLKTRRYEVNSSRLLEETNLPSRERKQLLQVATPVTPAVWSLVQSWRSNDANPRTVAVNALEFFRTQGFRYSLSPGEYKRSDLDEFLFHRRVGFCEHYAAAFATVMRLAGIPARVVAGYLGGDYNEVGHFFVVRQSDAHAWCEVWFPKTGWERIDPTGVVAPDRINLGLNSFLERRAAAGATIGGQVGRTLSRSPLIIKARLAWQALNYAWDVHVLSFDADAQESFFDSLNLNPRSLSPLIIGGVTVVVLLGGYVIWLHLRSQTGEDRVKTLYQTFCAKAARLGVTRNPSEGPLDFAQRAAALLPNQSTQIVQLSQNYITLRYSTNLDPRLLNQFAVEVVMFGRASGLSNLASHQA
jgi:transglutaminase-like putative cysteine protease